MFKVINEDTKLTPLASFWCLYCRIWACFTPFSSVSIANFEHINAGWVTCFQEEEEEHCRKGYIDLNSKKVIFKLLLCLKSLWNIALEITSSSIRLIFQISVLWNVMACGKPIGSPENSKMPIGWLKHLFRAKWLKKCRF